MIIVTKGGENMLVNLQIGGIEMQQLEVVRLYLFGDVKFLHFLILVMVLDVITGMTKALVNKNLFSSTAYFGYIKKLMIFIIIITVNVLDQILYLNGTLVYGTVIAYIAYEIISIFENIRDMGGVFIPDYLIEKAKDLLKGAYDNDKNNK